MIKEIPHLYKIMLSKYNIYCKNTQTGCPLILFYENLIEHEDHCHHEKLLCIFPNCFAKIKWKFYPKHIKEC